MDETERRGSTGIVRAKSAMARMLYRQFKDAGADDVDVVAFINELMSLLGSDGGGASEASSIIDGETGVVSDAVCRELIEFELRRAAGERTGSPRMAGVVTVCVPEFCPQGQRAEVHVGVATALRRTVRALDIVGRWGRERYVLVLPGMPERAGAALVARLRAALARTLPDIHGVRVGLQLTSIDAGLTSAAAVLEACTSAETIPVHPGSANEAPRRPASDPPDAAGVVLALGGGAARAAAHIGVIEVLQAHAIPILGVAGTSAGSLVAAMLALGRSPAQMLERFTSLTDSDAYAAIRRGFDRYRRRRSDSGTSDRYFRNSALAFLSGDTLAITEQAEFEAFVAHFVGHDREIRSLRLPFAACATDLREGCALPLARGSLHAALLASCAVPGLFPPQRIDDRLLVDGSHIAEVPVAAAARIAAGAPVLAVALRRPQRSLGEIDSSLELAIRTAALVHTELVREQLSQADLILTMPVHDVGWLGFHRAARIAAIGREQTERDVAGLRARLERLAPPTRRAAIG